MPAQTLPLFVQDILSQPGTLRSALRHLRQSDSAQIADLVCGRERIVLTGMGASHAALLPAWRTLVPAGFAAWHIDTAELLSLHATLVTARTVVIAASQSGCSAELVALAGRLQAPAALIALTNDPSSPLAKAAAAVIDIRSGVEHAVSTRSYLNTLVAASWMVSAVTRDEALDAWEDAARSIETYLESWRAHVEDFKSQVGLAQRLVLLARGSSMAAALYGALIIKEAAKCQVEAMSAAQFRHGPLELADERLTALVLAGEDPVARERNLRLAQDIRRYGGKAVWLDEGQGSALEAVRLQLLSVALAEQAGIEPGVFRHLRKVTVIE